MGALALILGASIAIISTGSFHGDEVPANTPGRWFALTLEDGSASLRSVAVKVIPERDALHDDEGESTGRRVEASPAIEPGVVLVRGLASLRAARLPTVLIQRSVEPDRGAEARFGQASYRLSVGCADRAPVDGQRQQQCELRLESGSVKQSLFTYRAYFEGNDRYWASDTPPTVVWAGDLDADGRLDILLDTSDHYNVNELRLYLSSAAKAGRLVSEVASFKSVGC